MARVVRAGEAELLSLPGRVSRSVVSGRQGSENVTFRIVEIAPLKPGEAERGPHVHHGFEECIHVLAGRGAMRTESECFEVVVGDTILVPPGELHVTQAAGEGALTLLCFFPIADVGAGTTEFESWEKARA